MRVDASYGDVCIRNISPRGMMLQAANPPRRGTYVEVLRGPHVIVARVVWTHERRFGIHTAERMDVAAVVNVTTPAGAGLPGQDRRSPERSRPAAPTMKDVAQQAERSRRFSRAFEFTVMAGGGLISAAAMGSLAYKALAVPFQYVSAHMVQHQ